MPHPLVVHCQKTKYDVYCGRPSKWGNPFEIGKDGNREQVIQKFKEYLLKHPTLFSEVKELKGKVLGCWCAPKACHCDILAEIANSEIDDIFGP